MQCLAHMRAQSRLIFTRPESEVDMLTALSAALSFKTADKALLVQRSDH